MTHTRISRVWLAVGLVLAGLTAQRFTVWQGGDLALWEDAAAKSHAPRPWINLGNAYSLVGRSDESELAYLQAEALADTRRSPEEWSVGGALALANRGILYTNQPICGVMDYAHPARIRDWPELYDPVQVRCNIGKSLIALAQDRWPESAEIHRLFLGMR